MSKILKDMAWPPQNVKDLGSKDVSDKPVQGKFNQLAEALKKIQLTK